ncbi:helix-hairpin-helix domain-containing protein [Phascolarctobacterium succinatutens]|jgi:competence protein comEA helix-hairpin-helix repeat region|uniref:helix-hairpin-helix domain-containing protein n=1 Tax=Phascolarctobacterium succinatutens TaxID=626940 RepID=UPI0026F08F7E|nr:helix-hairpin-helix domain-containing protein [Phascolarctobacterium succinatutens]MBS5427228.1 helix-hairpin-helix domain-containing protein [Phascolarctobacterium succinatutens]
MQAKSKKLIFITILLTGCIITSLISTNDKEKTLPGSSLLQSAQSAVTSKAAQAKTVRVQVSGAVLEPGIYDVPANCRVEEAIAAAGGLTENADSERVNLVRKVRDGMQIRVPVQKAARTSRTQRKNAQATAGLGESASEKYGSAKAGSGKKNNNQMPRVRINSASASELQQLPGIGPALAQRIVETRSRGRFTSTEDLLRVPGIGKAKMAKLRDYVEVD